MPATRARQIQSGRPSTGRCRAGSSAAASSIPRIVNSLVASGADATRRRHDASDSFAVALWKAGAQFGNLAFAHLGDGSVRGDTFLDRFERSEIVGPALRRHA